MTTYKTVHRNYSLEEYSPEWAGKFEMLAKTLSVAFEGSALQIEHVGSTAVVGMKAKPIIDVLIVVPDLRGLKACIDRMLSLGYSFKRDYIRENSLFFYKEDNGTRKENIHVFPKAHAHVRELLDKRDYLRAHPKEAKRYESIKVELAKKFPNDYASYRRGKDAYLNVELADKVSRWRNRR